MYTTFIYSIALKKKPEIIISQWMIWVVLLVFVLENESVTMIDTIV
jgi:hypothetical protein